MGALLVEILLPVAAVINVEVSLPVAKRLVSMLYGHCTEHARRARYSNVSAPCFANQCACQTLLTSSPTFLSHRPISLWLLFSWPLVNSLSFLITGMCSLSRTSCPVSRFALFASLI